MNRSAANDVNSVMRRFMRLLCACFAAVAVLACGREVPESVGSFGVDATVRAASTDAPTTLPIPQDPSRRSEPQATASSEVAPECSPVPEAWAPRSQDGWQLTLELSSASIAQGEPLQMKLSIRNVTDEPHSLFPNPIDFRVSNGSRLYWRYWHHRARGGIVRESDRVDFAPGETKSYENTWHQETCQARGPDFREGPVSAGRYVAEAGLTAYGWTSPPVMFEVQSSS